MDPTRPVTYRLLKFLLAHARRPYTQSELHRRTGASLGQVNQVVRWLEGRGLGERRNLPNSGRSGFALTDVGGVLNLFALARRMIPARRLALSGAGGELTGLVEAEGGVACLDTALAAYSDYFRTVGLFFYHPDPDALIEKLNPLAGGTLPLKVYLPDLPLEGDITKGRTGKVRTVIDLACANRLYAAEGLLRDLWGLELG